MLNQPKTKPKRRTIKSISKQRAPEKRLAFFTCDQKSRNAQPVWLYQFTFSSHFVSYVVVLLCVSTVLQPVTRVFAADDSGGDAVTEIVETQVVDAVSPSNSATNVDTTSISVIESINKDNDENSPLSTSDSSATSELALESVTIDLSTEVVGHTIAQDVMLVSDGSDALPAQSTHQVVATASENNFNNHESTPETVSDASDEVSESTTSQSDSDQVMDNASSTDSEVSTTTPNIGTTSEDVLTLAISDDNASTTQLETVSGNTAGGGGSSDNSSDESEQQVNEAELLPDEGDLTDLLAIQTELSSSSNLALATSTLSWDEGQPGVFDPQAVSVSESDDLFSFHRNECTVVEDGSYYCQKVPDVPSTEDRLTAASDADGDLEIYLIRNGTSTQLTFNEIDDAAPYYDVYSDTIVWHRLIDDRYQIISYDIQSATEEQITSNQTNNMEPARHGEYIVWQQWVDSNWEIILYDGKREQKITSSPEHDIAPHMRGSLVIWNSRFDDGRQQLQTYDIGQRTYTVIKDADGVTVSNPRMVVMYEAMYANGDVVTKGFDLISGEIVPLEALPRQLPDNIPTSEPTGEVRALSINKPHEQQSEEGEIDDPLTTDSPPDVDTGILGTSTLSVFDLDLRLATTSDTEIDSLQDSVPSATEAIIPDLMILPLTTTSTSTQP